MKATVVLATLTPTVTWAATFQTIYSFKSTDGANPYAGLVIDAAGNLYGTTLNGGKNLTICGGFGCGTAFKLEPPNAIHPAWKLTTIATFNNSPDGASPEGGLAFDLTQTNLYGTTAYGGGTNESGTVFQLSQPIANKWKSTTTDRTATL